MEVSNRGERHRRGAETGGRDREGAAAPRHKIRTAFAENSRLNRLCVETAAA
jgi:hypothetical protein